MAQEYWRKCAYKMLVKLTLGGGSTAFCQWEEIKNFSLRELRERERREKMVGGTIAKKQTEEIVSLSITEDENEYHSKKSKLSQKNEKNSFEKKPRWQRTEYF